MMQTGEFEPGDRVTLNAYGGLSTDAAARPFIGAECQILKMTRGGKYLVVLNTDENQTYPAKKKNLTKI